MRPPRCDVFAAKVQDFVCDVWRPVGPDASPVAIGLAIYAVAVFAVSALDG